MSWRPTVDEALGKLEESRHMANLTGFEIRDNLKGAFSDVYTPAVLDALSALAPLNRDVREVMAARLERRRRRAHNRERITFLDPGSDIPRTKLTVQDARGGQFDGAAIPADLQRQWIQGTGSAAKPNAPVEEQHPQRRLRAAVGRRRLDVRRRGRAGPGVDTMSLDNQRNLKLAIQRDPCS